MSIWEVHYSFSCQACNKANAGLTAKINVNNEAEVMALTHNEARCVHFEAPLEPQQPLTITTTRID